MIDGDTTFVSVMEDPEVTKKAKQHLALQVGDAITTLGILAKGGKELNPFLRLTPKNPVGAIVIPKIVGLVLVKKELEKLPKSEKEKAKKVLDALNLFYLVLVASNINQLSK